MEKSSKDIVKTPLVIQKKVLQPIKQPGQVTAFKEGNARAPAPRTKPAVARRAGASSSNRRFVLPLQVSLEETLNTVQVKLAGRLAFFFHKWKEITSDSLILEAISGYKLPFRVSPPPQEIEPSTILSRLEEDICQQEIINLSNKGAIELVSDCEDQFLSSFFVIRKSPGGWRFILNLKRLNEYIIAPHFKMEDWRTVVNLLSPNDFLTSIDLQDAYFLIPIHQEDRKFLRFRFRSQLFQFRVLPFDLASAPYIFSKILRPILHTLREKGFFSVAYLDDFLLIGPSYDQCRNNVRATVNLLTSLDFIINERKSMLTPSKVARFLVSVCPAVQYGLLHTKILEREKFLALLAANENFEARMSLPASIREDLLWWKNVFTDYAQHNKIRSGLFIREIFSAASLTGWGAVCGKSRTHGFWSPEEKQKHINFLELLAVFHALRCFASDLRNGNILLRVDNSTALSYINRMGSIKFPTLSNLARQIWMWCADRDLFVYASYIPSAQNIEADAESRVISEESEWALNQGYFSEIEAYFGPFDVDLFATSINAKCTCFVSWLPDPLAFAGDSSSMEQDLPGGRQIIRQAFLTRGTPASALDATLASLSEATINQYTRPLRLWWNFYPTLRFYLGPISGHRPLSFDVSSEELSLELVSRKLVTLLALTTAQRLQTLAAIRLSNIVFADSLVIKIPARLKTSKIGRPQPLLVFKPFLDKPELCIYSLTGSYIERTKELRPEDANSLFIAVRSPYNSVSAQTLGRWIKMELRAAGVNTAIFSAHSTRHASTSFAAGKGVSVDEIRRTAESLSDTSILNALGFGQALEHDELNLPPPKLLPNSTIILAHHYFVGEEIFLLRLNLLRPYARKTY
ncbi:PREDICTED: uncharacterized protein LOC108781208 [Cyphomyrmex costatus]|uniref:uncharacterized protein LOC108781208 n=1 Tax=Cyphomyrmex costatus TaxID=456900 RepID=UPI00085234F5|nr:PREDICTED: uncharacterized protein LOC108781208 [Cyphomyrmex costatus]